MKKFTYVIGDPDGIHARPAGKLVKEAGNFQSAITLECEGRIADAKRLFSVMSLGAVCGREITVKIEGGDEAEAAEAMETFLRENL